jgi:hypothetical protein
MSLKEKGLHISTYQPVLGMDAGFVIVVLDHVEEIRVIGVRNVSQPLRDGPAVGVEGLTGANFIKLFTLATDGSDKISSRQIFRASPIFSYT